jgi:thermostable 8-oxoguanine DNA glycosylase
MTNREKFLKVISATPDTSDETTTNLFSLTNSVKRKGFISKDLGMKILKWKSHRPTKHYDKNSKADFENITKNAFQQKDEKIKIHILTALTGVSYPAASAILMFYDPDQYPVIDIRVWKQLYKNGLLTENPKGQNFTLYQWETYLNAIRQIAKELAITPRQVEKRLFDHGKKNQIGTLYKTTQKITKQNTQQLKNGLTIS